MDGAAEKQAIGVIGLGSMGLGVALALVDAGFEVFGCDLSSAAQHAFSAGGGRIAATPADVARHTDMILIVVVNAQQVENVLFGADGVVRSMNRHGLIIQCSTVAPSYIRDLGCRLVDIGFDLIDAPLSGGSAKARSGELTVMLSGSPANCARAEGVWPAVAQRVFRFGTEPGAASGMKLVNQHLAGIHLAAAAEAMALGIKMGVDPETLYEVITNCAGNSWMFEHRVPRILAGDYRARNAVNIFVKDLEIVHATGCELALPLPVACSALQQFMAARATGHGQEDDVAVIRVYEHLTGIKLPVSEGTG